MAGLDYWSLLQSGSLWLLLLFPVTWLAFSSRRWSFRMAILAIAGIAILIAQSVNDSGSTQLVAWIEFRSTDVDAGAISREILSPEVLGDALDRPITSTGDFALSTLPRFRVAPDPRAELRRLLKIDATSSKSHSLRLSIDLGPQNDEHFILKAVAESYERSLGSTGIVTHGPVRYSTKRSPSQAKFLLIIMSCWLICLYLLKKQGGEMKGGKKGT